LALLSKKVGNFLTIVTKEYATKEELMLLNTTVTRSIASTRGIFKHVYTIYIPSATNIPQTTLTAGLSAGIKTYLGII